MELYSMLMQENIEEYLENNKEQLLELIPEIKSILNFEHKNPHHDRNVWQHTLYALSLSEKDFDIRLTLLLHDIGKPFSYQEGPIRHYNNHPKVSAQIANKILKRLNYSEDYINKICYLIYNHDYPISKKLIQENYELALKLYQIQWCDSMAHNPKEIEIRKKYLAKTLKKIKENKI